MDHDLICSWLGLSPGTWPPDHYRLLGLEAGEDDAERIEQHVHERLDTVRCYQMTHPEQATEAMNRLAQAFVCLTEASAKRTYDAQLGISAPAALVPTDEAPVVPPSSQTNTLDWLSNAPAIDWPRKNEQPAPALNGPSPRVVPATLPPTNQPPPLPLLLPAVIVPPTSGETPAPPTELPRAIPMPTPLPAGPPLEPVDPVLEDAQSGRARRGITTKRGIYLRIARTRRLLRLWNQLGKYLGTPKRRFRRSVDGPELVRLLDEIAHRLGRFPPMLGEAGQPGYLVLALTQMDTIKVFLSFSPHQREALSRDWGASLKLLTAHRDFLRQQLRAMRKRSLKQRLLSACWSLVVDRPGTLLVLLALLALAVALWRTYTL